MRYLLVGLAMLASQSAGGGGRQPAKLGVGYHDSYGIPQAANIMAFEVDIVCKQVGMDMEVCENFEETDLLADDWITNVAATRAQPYFGGLVIGLTTGDISACGSSLLTQNRLVTAAHCWWDGRSTAWRFTVVLGSVWLFYGGTRIITSHVVVHPKWNPAKLENNVAMIYLPTSVWFSVTVKPIGLPSPSQVWHMFTGERALAVGFGQLENPEQTSGYNVTAIRQVRRQVMSVEQCQDFFGHWAHGSNICTSGTGGIGICHGYSGGPLLVNRFDDDYDDDN